MYRSGILVRTLVLTAIVLGGLTGVVVSAWAAESSREPSGRESGGKSSWRRSSEGKRSRGPGGRSSERPSMPSDGAFPARPEGGFPARSEGGFPGRMPAKPADDDADASADPVDPSAPDTAEKPGFRRLPGAPDTKPGSEEPSSDDVGEAPSDEPRAEKEPMPPVRTGSEKIRFRFRFQPWKDVLDWFARQADLSLVADSPPSGTFNYSDDRDYTPAEAIDLLNSVLLTKGYTLIRRGRMLMLINLEDGIPPNLVSTVPLESLDTKGEFELVSVLFDLDKLRPEEAEGEIKRLTGPQGSVVALTKSRQVLVTETAGRLRAIRSVLARIEGTDAASASSVKIVELKHVRAEDVLPILRQLLEIPEDKPAALDGSIRIAAEAGTGRLVVSGRPEKITRVLDTLKGLDVPTPGAEALGPASGASQLEVYPITGADPLSVLAVLQTLFVGQSDVRLAIDSRSSSLVALARPQQQATIRATLAQMQQQGQQVEVIRLTRVDPQTAVLAISKLFGGGDPTKGTAPQIDADPASRQLFVRGTEPQILQIRGLLEKMGEPSSTSAAGTTSGGNVRMIPLTGRAAQAALDKIEEIWPTLRQNKIRVVSPSADASKRDSEDDGPASIPPELLKRLREVKPEKEKPEKVKPVAPETVPGVLPQPATSDREEPKSERSTRLWKSARAILVSQPQTTAPPTTQPPAKSSANPAPIVVVPGPGGLIISSEDTQALDEFERLLNSVADSEASNTSDITIFYLKHAKAVTVGATLDQIFGGGTIVPEPAGPGMGQMGGGASSSGVMSALARLGAGRKIIATGTIKITPDNRLNALVVQANATDQDTIEQLLKILDQKESPEDVSVAPKPRMIPVENTKAQEVADIVRQVYADRMVTAAGGANQQQFMPPWMMMAQGGGQRQQRGGGQQRGAEDAARISIGVDTRTNSLIVAAPDTLFEEVKQLVEQLDVAAGDQNEAVRVVTLHRASPDAVQRALSAIAGDTVQMTRTPMAGAPGGQSMPGGSRMNGMSGAYSRGRMPGGMGGQTWQGGQGGQSWQGRQGQPSMGGQGMGSSGGGGRSQGRNRSNRGGGGGGMRSN